MTPRLELRVSTKPSSAATWICLDCRIRTCAKAGCSIEQSDAHSAHQNWVILAIRRPGPTPLLKYEKAVSESCRWCVRACGVAHSLSKVSFNNIAQAVNVFIIGLQIIYKDRLATISRVSVKLHSVSRDRDRIVDAACGQYWQLFHHLTAVQFSSLLAR